MTFVTQGACFLRRLLADGLLMPLRAPYLPAKLPHFAGACDKSHCGSMNSGVAYSALNRLQQRGRGIRDWTRGGSVDHLCLFRNRLPAV